MYLAEPDYFDDGPVKPVRIWSRVGRRPILAAGNSNGDIEMLRFAGGPSRPGCGCWCCDDPDREFDYTAGPSARLRKPRRRAGRRSASNATGRPSSTQPTADQERMQLA